MLLSDLLAQSADRFPDKTALIFPEHRVTFAALEHRSRQVASHLRRAGVGLGARVAILYENSLEAVVFFWGALKAGAQVVDVPCLAGIETTLSLLAEAKPVAIAISERQRRRLGRSAAGCLPPRILSAASLTEIADTERADSTRARVSDGDVALIIYTSGTSGKPKGVMLSHRNLLSNIVSVNSVMRLTSDDSILSVVPLHFIHGRMQLLTHAMVGATVAFSSGFQFPQRVADELIAHGTTGLSGVPFHFSALLAQTNIASAPPPQLRYVVVTGGALPVDALKRLSAALPGVAIYIGYGQTEASPRITTLSSCDLFRKPGSCGVPTAGVTVQVVDDSGVAQRPGVVGEVVVSGPNVMRSYVSGDEIALGTIDQQGRLHTGDLGKFDFDGYLYLVGRKSDLIKCAGERIFPQEIECVLDSHEAVASSAVLGLPDEVFGERIVACVVPQSGTQLTVEELRTHCLKSLPLVRVPREIRFCATIPRTASGKTNRGKLAEHFHALEATRAMAAAGKGAGAE
jgi:long-chain acyl-CoA synthetase